MKLLAIFLLLITAQANAQQKLYVSPSGNDNNIGTISSPFKTIAAAIKRGAIFSGKKLEIFLRKGKYYLGENRRNL